MHESTTMKEIRKIKEANSIRYLQMSSEELERELNEVTKKFIEELGSGTKAVSRM